MRTLIIGAGLSGLAAAHELRRAGHDVGVLEAAPFAGGRVRTLRGDTPPEPYAEAGAMAVSDCSPQVMRFARLLNVSLVPLSPRAVLTYHLRGRRLRVAAGETAHWPYALGTDEGTGRLNDLFARYLLGALDRLGPLRTTPEGEPLLDRLGALDEVSFAAHLAADGASSEALELLAQTSWFGTGWHQRSALQVLLADLALFYRAQAVFAIRDGSDRLVEGFTQTLSEVIEYESPVVRLRHDEREATVDVDGAQGIRSLTADRVVCAIPLTLLRRVEIVPPLSRAKQTAVEALPYEAVTRVYVWTRRRPWAAGGDTGDALTDLPIGQVQEHPIAQAGAPHEVERPGLLEAHTRGQPARDLGALSDEARLNTVLGALELVHPGVGDEVATVRTVVWEEEPWASGAYSRFPPGTMTTWLPELARREGRIHFAGEHTSPWSGTVEGALASGVRAAREIISRTRVEDARAAPR